MLPPELELALSRGINLKEETPDEITLEFRRFIAPKGRERFAWIGKIKAAAIPNEEDFTSPSFRWKNALFFGATCFIFSEISSGFILRMGITPVNEIISEILFKGVYSFAAGSLFEFGRSRLVASTTTPSIKK